MIWQAICSCGMRSKPFLTTSTLNSKIYIEECLQKRLLPLIRQHNEPIIFWPDLASIHYSRMTLKWFDENGIQVVPKDSNPPNCPEFRPIERFWAIAKQFLKKSRGTITDEASMLRQWNRAAASIENSVVQKQMAAIKKKVRLFVRTGVMPE